MTNITITIEEYRLLKFKTILGWKMYDKLNKYLSEYAEEIEESCGNTAILRIEKSGGRVLTNIQRLLDTHEKRKKCSICLEDDLDIDNSIIKKCLHRFHETCLTEYQDISHTYKCPTCRQ